MVLRRLKLLICALRWQLQLGRWSWLGLLLLLLGLTVAAGRSGCGSALGSTLLGLYFGLQSAGNVRPGVLPEVVLAVEAWNEGWV